MCVCVCAHQAVCVDDVCEVSVEYLWSEECL